MSFDASTLFLSLITSGIGFVLFVYGKKEGRPPQLVAGIVMSVYPYFVSNLLLNVLAGAGSIAVMWLAIRQGY